MMFNWMQQGRQPRSEAGNGRRARFSRSWFLRRAPARLGLLGLALFCLAVAAWDVAVNGFDGSLPLEQPLVDVDSLPRATVASQPSTDDGNVNNVSDINNLANVSNVNDANAEGAAAGQVAATEAAAQAQQAQQAMFASYRLERAASREAELELLREIVNDEACSQIARQDAEQRRLQIAAAIESEATAESLLLAQDYGQCVVLLGNERATVICALELNAERAAKIAALVSEACGVSFENVVIVNQ